MVSVVRSLGLTGVAGYEVKVECDLSDGLPTFDVVGLPDTAVKEARNRVRSATKNAGYTFPLARITVNLAPADRRKEGTVYDLPMLVGLLQGSGQILWRSVPMGLCRRGGFVRRAAPRAGDTAHGAGRPAGWHGGTVRSGGERSGGCVCRRIAVSIR